MSSLTLRAAAELPSISIDGSHFFYPNGSQYYLRGIMYQDYGRFTWNINSIADSLGNVATCKRDISNLVKLNVNVIRVFKVDPSADHSGCLKLLQDAGIYVLVELGGGAAFFDLLKPDSPVWTHELYRRFTGVVDSLHGYSNVLGFFVGRAMVLDPVDTTVLPFFKAVARDIKGYIKKKGYRNIPVGIAATNGDLVRSTADYLNCGEPEETADFYGIDLWCQYNDLVGPGNSSRQQEFRTYPKPAFISVYGCNSVFPRYSEADYIYGDKGMTHVFSGGVAFQYFNDSYLSAGVVEVDGNNAKVLPDFSILSTHLATATPTGTPKDKWPSPTMTQGPCPTTGSNWLADKTLPPVPSERICKCMMKSLSCVSSSSITEQEAPSVLKVSCSQDESMCLGTSSNTTTGQYGAYSICSTRERLSWVMNQNLLSRKPQGKDSAQTCLDLGGVNKTPEISNASNDDCQILLRQAGPLGTGTITSTPSMAPTATDSLLGLQSQPSSPLSKSTKVGIGISATVSLLLVVTLALLFYRRRRNKRISENQDTDILEKSDFAKPELADNQVTKGENGLAMFLDGTSKVEADSCAVVAELPGSDMPEFPGDHGASELPTENENEKSRRRPNDSTA